MTFIIFFIELSRSLLLQLFLLESHTMTEFNGISFASNQIIILVPSPLDPALNYLRTWNSKNLSNDKLNFLK